MQIRISRACAVLGVCPKTLRLWEKNGLLPAERTKGNHRRYDLDMLHSFRINGDLISRINKKTGIAAIYARESDHRQKTELQKQRDFLISCAEQDGYIPKVYAEIGSGMNDTQPKLHRLIRDGMEGVFDCLYLTYLDRLARFGTMPILETFRYLGISVFVKCVPDRKSIEESIVADLVAILTSFAGELYAKRTRKNQ